MAQSKAEFSKIPEVDFKVSAVGITILCGRLYTPRFVPFDIRGKCECCRSDAVELDFVITKEGITIYCNRLQKPRFVPFDYPYQQLPNYCMFRVKTRAKIFNIEHGSSNNQTDILTETINNVFTSGELEGNTQVQLTQLPEYPEYYNL